MSSSPKLSELAKKSARKEKAARAKQKRKPKIKIGHIDGVLPFDGVHNPLSRSTRSYKIGRLIRCANDDFKPRVALCDSEAEDAMITEALLRPNVVSVKCQPVKIPLPDPKITANSHTFDLRIEFERGYRILVYVKGAVNLASSSSQPQIDVIVKNTPRDFADRIVVISDASFSPVYRDNNQRIMMCHEMPNQDADQAVAEYARRLSAPVRLETVVTDIGGPQHAVYQAIMRNVGAGVIGTERDAVIDYPSFVWGVHDG